MRIVGRQLLADFVSQHSDAKSWIENWIRDTELSEWKTPQDVKDKYASASFLAKNIVIFNVKGNRYRLEVLLAYATGTVVIRSLETHAEYSKAGSRKK